MKGKDILERYLTQEERLRFYNNIEKQDMDYRSLHINYNERGYSSVVSSSFIFSNSEEGSAYWYDICDKLDSVGGLVKYKFPTFKFDGVDG